MLQCPQFPCWPSGGVYSPPSSPSYTKPSVLEWNGSLPLIDSIYGCPCNTLVVPKGCHFSICIPYNFISIWQLLTVSQIEKRMGTEWCLWNRKINCKKMYAGRGFSWKTVSKVSSHKLYWQKTSTLINSTELPSTSWQVGTSFSNGTKFDFYRMQNTAQPPAGMP